jgi:hypothetical protein
MTAYCRARGSRNLRPSHLQPKDLVYFLILCHPIRCRYCRKRSYVSIFKIREIQRDARARDVRHEKDKSKPKAVALDQERSEDLR